MGNVGLPGVTGLTVICCTPQQSDERKWVKFGVHRQVFSSESQFGFEIRQGFAKIAASEAANGKSRMKRSQSV